MLTWAIAWAAVRLKNGDLTSWIFLTMLADVAIVAAITAPFWAPYSCGE